MSFKLILMDLSHETPDPKWSGCKGLQQGWLGGGFQDFLFSPRKLGKISNLTNIFEMGWFNHQPVGVVRTKLRIVRGYSLIMPAMHIGVNEKDHDVLRPKSPI